MRLDVQVTRPFCKCGNVLLVFSGAWFDTEQFHTSEQDYFFVFLRDGALVFFFIGVTGPRGVNRNSSRLASETLELTLDAVRLRV